MSDRIAAAERRAMPTILEEQVLAALNPDPVFWLDGDDKCDCPMQRIGEMFNPYIAQTVQIRLCCIWRELGKLFPHLYQEVPAYYDLNTASFEKEPAEWDSEEADMPLYLWHRQYARQHGITVGEARDLLRNRESERPRKKAKGTGRAAKPQPSQMEVAVGHLTRLAQTGWNTEDFAARLMGGSK